MRVKAVLFDLGGTLWAPFGTLEREEALYLASEAAAKRLEAHVLFHEREALGRRLAGSVRCRLAGLRPFRDPLCTEYPPSQSDLREVDLKCAFLETVRALGIAVTQEDAASITTDFAFDLDRHYQVYPDVLPALRRLRRDLPHVKVGIVSNTSIPEEVLEFHLGEAGILGLTDFRVFSSVVGWRKPHPAIYARALELSKTPPDNTAFVGDRLLEDVIGPKSMGMKTVWRWTGDVPVQSESLWDAVIPDFSSLPEVIARLR